MMITRGDLPLVVIRPFDPIRDGIDRQEWWKKCTPFQRKVYEAILKIPKGQVRTYAWVARQIGQPKAARAVGQALKRNRWAPQIPCHRVVSSKFFVHRKVHRLRRIPRSGIASDGTLGGYSAKGGLAAKRRLLKEEGFI